MWINVDQPRVAPFARRLLGAHERRCYSEGADERGVAGRHNQTVEPIECDDFVIRPTRRDDLAVLLEWHSDPDVYRFWDRRPLTREEIGHKYLGGRLPHVRCFIIESPPGQPVGFIQHADLDAPGDIGIDMFLIPTSQGKGLGPRVARHLAEHLLTTGSTQRVTVDPLIANNRAVAAWKKAGFREHSPIEAGDHGEPAVLMVFQPS